ncbi:hypothetical protein D3C85_1216540 [compost metagenome]
MNLFLFIKEKLKIQREMSLEEDIEFKNAIKSHIKILEDSPEYPKDIALQHIVEILKVIKTKSDLKKQKDLINRIAIDSVENWKTINTIGEFLKTH